jgi:hypothetical protein
MNAFPPLGMSPAVWGPIFWTTMHIVSLGYSMNPTSQEREAAVQFYESLQYVIPCPICRSHYSEFLKQSPVNEAVKDRNTLIQWVYTIHNQVNKKLNKPELSFEAYVKNMQALAAQQSVKLPPQPYAGSSLGLVLTGAALGGVAYYMYRKYAGGK